MNKILITALIFCVVTLSLTGCGDGETIMINVENNETLNNNVIGSDALVKIGDGLYYDSTTTIVYFWNGILYGQYATTPSLYYAPNGFPYKYNPETNTLEEIKENRTDG